MRPALLSANAASPPDRISVVRAVERLALKQGWTVAVGIVLLLVTSVTSISLGVDSLTPWKALGAIAPNLLPAAWTADLTTTQITVLQNLRMPRTVMAMISGAGLAMAGVAMQGITRNPLVSPYTLGISPAAAFGASLAI